MLAIDCHAIDDDISYADYIAIHYAMIIDW
jgi:hypothetical protein